LCQFINKYINTTGLFVISEELHISSKNATTVKMLPPKNYIIASKKESLGKRIAINTGEARETSYLFQRISVLVQRFNAVLLHDSLPAADCTD